MATETLISKLDVAEELDDATADQDLVAEFLAKSPAVQQTYESTHSDGVLKMLPDTDHF